MIAYPFGAGGVRTRVLEAGSGDDHVVLLHGAGARADRWAGTIRTLAAAGHHVVALDFPGHGFAEKGPGVDCSVPGYAHFVRECLDELGLERVTFIGTSLGGHVAATVALSDPGRVRALVLVGATGLLPNGEERRRRTAARLRDTSFEGIADKLQAVILDASSIDEEFVREEWRINNSPGAAESFLTLSRYFEERLDVDCVGDDLARLTTTLPVLLVWGQGDGLVPVETGRLAAELLGAPLVEIEGAGHAPYSERPDAFSAAVTQFLASLEATA